MVAPWYRSESPQQEAEQPPVMLGPKPDPRIDVYCTNCGAWLATEIRIGRCHRCHRMMCCDCAISTHCRRCLDAMDSAVRTTEILGEYEAFFGHFRNCTARHIELEKRTPEHTLPEPMDCAVLVRCLPSVSPKSVRSTGPPFWSSLSGDYRNPVERYTWVLLQQLQQLQPSNGNFINK